MYCISSTHEMEKTTRVESNDHRACHKMKRNTRRQVPSEVFRLGRTRVFFRAGQISTLQKILNETGPEKGPWIFERLQEALANRHKAKAAAEEAQVRKYVGILGINACCRPWRSKNTCI